MRQKIAFFLAGLLLSGSVAFPVFAEDSVESKSVRLSSYQGDVKVEKGSVTLSTLSDGMRLFDGCTVTTGQEAHAFLELDDSKFVKTDQNTQVKVTKSGSTNLLSVASGSLFFNITKPLAENETMKVRTANLTMGIRGTSGAVAVAPAYDASGTPSSLKISAQIYNGKGEVTLKNETTGQTGRYEILPGQQLEMQVDGATGAQSVNSGNLDPSGADIPSVALFEISKDPELREKIAQQSSLNPDLFAKTAQENLRRENAATAAAQTLLSQAQNQYQQMIKSQGKLDFGVIAPSSVQNPIVKGSENSSKEYVATVNGVDNTPGNSGGSGSGGSGSGGSGDGGSGDGDSGDGGSGDDDSGDDDSGDDGSGDDDSGDDDSGNPSPELVVATVNGVSYTDLDEALQAASSMNASLELYEDWTPRADQLSVLGNLAAMTLSRAATLYLGHAQVTLPGTVRAMSGTEIMFSGSADIHVEFGNLTVDSGASLTTNTPLFLKNGILYVDGTVNGLNFLKGESTGASELEFMSNFQSNDVPGAFYSGGIALTTTDSMRQKTFTWDASNSRWKTPFALAVVDGAEYEDIDAAIAAAQSQSLGDQRIEIKAGATVSLTSAQANLLIALESVDVCGTLDLPMALNATIHTMTVKSGGVLNLGATGGSLVVDTGNSFIIEQGATMNLTGAAILAVGDLTINGHVNNIDNIKPLPMLGAASLAFGPQFTTQTIGTQFYSSANLSAPITNLSDLQGKTFIPGNDGWQTNP